MSTLQIKVNEKGAELASIQLNGREYLWWGDAVYWNRQAPILFPNVGKVFDNTFRVNGKAYHMGQHGFARDVAFKKEGERYVLQGGPWENYPYRFCLSVRYRTEGQKLFCEWEVLNEDTQPMHFQIGAHPALLLPDYKADDPVHGYLQCYDAEGKVVAQPLMPHGLDSGYITQLPAPGRMPVEDTLLPLMADTFAIDTYVMENEQVKSVMLYDKHKRPYLSVGSDQAQAYGIWAPHKPGCPFVCLEPWCGITDLYGFDGDISERYLIHRLAPGEAFKFTYWIEIF